MCPDLEIGPRRNSCVNNWNKYSLSIFYSLTENIEMYIEDVLNSKKIKNYPYNFYVGNIDSYEVVNNKQNNNQILKIYEDTYYIMIDDKFNYLKLINDTHSPFSNSEELDPDICLVVTGKSLKKLRKLIISYILNIANILKSNNLIFDDNDGYGDKLFIGCGETFIDIISIFKPRNLQHFNNNIIKTLSNDEFEIPLLSPMGIYTLIYIKIKFNNIINNYDFDNALLIELDYLFAYLMTTPSKMFDIKHFGCCYMNNHKKILLC